MSLSFFVSFGKVCRWAGMAWRGTVFFDRVCVFGVLSK